MKLSTATLDFIRKVVSTAEIVKIDSIIIEPNRVRAIDDSHTVFICHVDDVPEMEFGSIGLNRIGVFNSRFDIGKTLKDFSVEAVVEGSDPDKKYARSLIMKATGVTVEYRCARPDLLRAPKAVNDVETYVIQANPEAIMMLQKGQSAMSTDDVTFVGSDEGVVFEMTDINADKMTYQFADAVHRIDDEDEASISFSHSYPLKTILPLLKSDATGFFTLTSQGILKVMVNGLSVYVMPRA